MIFQLNEKEEQKFFWSTDFLKKKGIIESINDINIDSYNSMYEMDIQEEKISNEILEKIFEKFNIDRPADFKGHSLSVSDVIGFEKSGRKSAYYIEDIGFSKLERFYKEV